MEKKEQELGSMENIRMKIDKPMAMDFTIEYRKLNLFTGLNGSGKSLIMKMSWACETIMSILLSKAPSTDEAVQYVLDNCFDDQNFNGEIEATFPKGMLKLILDNGKIKSVEHFIDPSVTICNPSVFMSTNTRTFTQINQFLKIEKTSSDPENILQFFKLYDVIFVNILKHKLANGYKPTEEFKKTIKEEFKIEHDFDTFAIENDAVVWIDKDGKRSNLSTLSAGDQSLINMTLASEK